MTVPREHNYTLTVAELGALSDEEIRAAVFAHGKLLGSHGSYMLDELQRIFDDRAGLVVFEDEPGRRRAFYRRPCDRL